jgi:hypothetical protein
MTVTNGAKQRHEHADQGKKKKAAKRDLRDDDVNRSSSTTDCHVLPSLLYIAHSLLSNLLQLDCIA